MDLGRAVSAISDGFTATRDKAELPGVLELESLLDEILSNQCSQWPLAQQRKLFSVLLDELKHEENRSLVESIAWDLVTLVLPYVGVHRDGPVTETWQHLVSVGNAKEVFVKLVELGQSLEWPEMQAEDAGHGMAVEVDGERFSAVEITLQRVLAVLEGFEKVFPRIHVRKLSRFHSECLTTVLGMYAESSGIGLAEFLRLSRAAFTLLQSLEGQIDMSVPRTDEIELEIRFMQAFLTYLLEVLVTKTPLNFAMAKLVKRAEGVPSDAHDAELESISQDAYALARACSLSADTCVASLRDKSEPGTVSEEEEEEEDVEYPEKAASVHLASLGCFCLLALRLKHEDQDFRQALRSYKLDFAQLLSAGSTGALDIYVYFVKELGMGPDILETATALGTVCASSPHPGLRSVAYNLLKEAYLSMDRETQVAYASHVLQEAPWPNLRAQMLALVKDALCKASADEQRRPDLPFLVDFVFEQVLNWDSAVRETEASTSLNYAIHLLNTTRFLLLQPALRSACLQSRDKQDRLKRLLGHADQHLKSASALAIEGADISLQVLEQTRQAYRMASEEALEKS